MIRAAEISWDKKYRYALTRTWDLDRPHLVFVMLNPSTADNAQDDPTIRRCIRFARDMGYGGIIVVNLYAFRATAPTDMRKTEDPVGPENDDFLLWALELSDALDQPVIAAWGALARPERVRKVAAFPHADRLHALGVTADGMPRHPLYLPASSRPTPWRLP